MAEVDIPFSATPPLLFATGHARPPRLFVSITGTPRRVVCSRNVQMSVPSQLEMSVSAVVWRAAGGDVGGGAEHERWGAAASRGVAGRRSRWSAGWCSGITKATANL